MTSILKVDNIKDSANNQAISISGGNITVAGNLTVSGTATGTSVGDNQSWTDVTSSRSSNTVYTNSTGRPILVSVGLEIVAGGATVNWFYVGSVIVAMIQNTSAELATTTSFIVPNGATYKHQYQSVAPTIRNWSELR